MKKLLAKLLIALLVLVVALYACRNYIARKSVEVGAEKATGFPLEIGSVNLGLFKGTLEVRNLKLMNPPEFQEKLFVDVPLFRVDYHTMSIISGSPHIKELAVNAEEVVLVKNEKGQSNAQVLQAKITPASTSTGGGQPPKTEPATKTHYRVDLIRMHIGTVRVLDYSKGKPTEKKFTLNKDVVFNDVTESTSISALVMNTIFGQVGQVAGELMKGLGSSTKGATDTLQKSGKGMVDKLKQAAPQKK